MTHPTSLVDEMKVVRMVVSNISISISSPFSTDLISTTPFRYTNILQYSFTFPYTLYPTLYLIYTYICIHVYIGLSRLPRTHLRQGTKRRDLPVIRWIARKQRLVHMHLKMDRNLYTVLRKVCTLIADSACIMLSMPILTPLAYTYTYHLGGSFGGYKIVTQDTAATTSREDLLEMRSKKKSDRFCY